MSSNRMERGYERGYEIDYPPPVITSNKPKIKSSSVVVAPPLPPKMINNNNNHPSGGHMSLSCGSNVTSKLGEVVSGGGTWTPGYEKTSSLLDSHDRFKPERGHRRQVQRMKWNDTCWTTGASSGLAGDLFSYKPSQFGSTAAGASSKNNNGNRPSYFNHVPLPPLESLSRVSSMTIADVSPRIALKKVLMLYEQGEYLEAAKLITALSVGTFRIVLRELPIDVFLEAMPHSLPILQALYDKIFAAEGPNVDLTLLKPDALLTHMVKFFSREEANQSRRKESVGSFTSCCKKILGVLVVSDPSFHKRLVQRDRAMSKAVEGLGQHGLVGTSDESLLPLHEALRLEFLRVVDTYKKALSKLDELSLSGNKGVGSKVIKGSGGSSGGNVAKGPAPIASSHQRQLSLKSDEIQERLIKNKSILNAVEATMDNSCLDILLAILQRRVHLDKEALFHFTQIRKETGEVSSAQSQSGGNSSSHQQPANIVAPTLMRFSKGCRIVLDLMKEVGTEVGACLDDFEDDSSDLSGYHSDSDSAIMTSGNSPFVTPRARFNFISRSVRSKQVLRPSLSKSLHSWGNHTPTTSRSTSKRSVGGSSLDSSLSLTEGDRCSRGNTPQRPRHVKMKSLLYKNNSLGSSVSSGESDLTTTNTNSSTSGCGTSLEEEEANETTPTCMECVTVVSVPDNQVLSQGLNHHCRVKGQQQISPTGSNGTTTNSSEESSSAASALIDDLRTEVAQLRIALQNAHTQVYHLQEKFRSTGGPLHNKNQGLLRKVPESTDAPKSLEEKKVCLVREYGALYAQARVQTMDALDALPELAEADELKSKLLFSVVVLSFRSVQTRLVEIKDQVSSLLQFDTSNQHSLKPCQLKLIEALSEYLSNSQQKFDQSRCVEHVANQLWSTLYDYPCLRKCEGLLRYIRTCVNLAWGLSNLTPPCVLEYERRQFSRDTHVRFHSSDPSSDTVKTYLWPALLDGADGPCVHKGVVIT